VAIGLMLGACAAQAQAAEVDWRAAGGELFVSNSPADATSEADMGGQPLRLTPPTFPYAEAVSRAADRFGLDPKLLRALVVVESGSRADAVSKAGAAGLTQLMPATAAALGVRDRFDPSANVMAGADYLARQLLRFGDLRLALAAYNAGPSRVAALGRVPSTPETRAYVASVLTCFLALTAGRRVLTAKDCQSVGGPP
jgi:soluble lytic murein transglycosylase-like protein